MQRELALEGKIEEVFVINHSKTGRRVRVVRKALGLSIRKLACRMGISKSYLFDLEHGNRRWNEALMKKFNKVGLTPPERSPKRLWRCNCGHSARYLSTEEKGKTKLTSNQGYFQCAKCHSDVDLY